MTPAASIVITTRNRRDELRGAVASCLLQDVPIEVLVIDDASTDGTADMLALEFPTVRLDRSDQPRGYIVQRNRAAELVRSPFIVSIDDDALFTDPTTVRQALAAMNHPRVGALAMPFINVNQGRYVHQQAPDERHVYARQWFIGTAHVLKADLFRKLGGYRAFFYSQFEEFDYCLRLLDAGYIVRTGNTPVIHHLVSPKRVRRQIVHYGERNQMLLAGLNYPAMRVPGAWARTVRHGLARGWRERFFGASVAGLARGAIETLRFFPHRRAVNAQTYRRWIALGSAGEGMPIEQLERIG